MKRRYLAMGLMALGALIGAVSSPAQVYKSTTNKSFTALIGNYASDYIYDTTTDSAGNRYVTGYIYDAGSATYYGYTTKITKKGFVSWTTFYFDYPNCVAADNAGHVYVGVPSSTPSFAVRQLDAATGAVNYTSAETPYGGYLDDIAILPNGNPVTASDTYFYSAYRGVVLQWPADNSAQAEGWIALGEGGHVNKVIVGPDGAVYTAGFTYDADGSGHSAGQIMYIQPGFSNELIPVPIYDLNGTNEYFTDIAIDPVTNTALAVGATYATGFNDTTPWIGTFYADYSSGSLVPNYQAYYLPGYVAGSYAQGVAADPVNGSFAIAVNSDTAGTPRASVYSVGEIGGTPYYLYTNWAAYNMPATDQGTVDYPLDIAMDGNGPVLAVVSDLTIGTGSSAYKGVQTFSFAHDGTFIDREIFGQASIAPVYLNSSPYYDFLRDSMTTDGGFLSIFAYGTDGHGSVRTAQLKKGPNDVYRVDEDTTLTVGVAKGVLLNDGNAFKYDPLTAQLVNSSVSAGIHAITFNPNGTFTVDFNPNYNGVAHFNYKVKQNGGVLATNHVTINVKAKNDPPTAVDDSFNVAMNSAVQNLNVLGNDSDLDGDNITIFSKTNNANATIGITADKKFITFKPKTGFSGNLNFTYTIRDPQGLQSTATVTVHVS